MRKIKDVLKFFNLKIDNYENIFIKNIKLDSRIIKSNDVFVALKGLDLNGNAFIEKAINNGASLILTDSESYADNKKIFYINKLKDKLHLFAQWFYSYKKINNIIGITGTNGKTSISHYFAQALYFLNQKTLLLGTNGNGMFPNLEESSHTTLDKLSLYKQISKYNNAENIVMEVSSHSLAQNRIQGLEFDYAVFSNLTHDHLDYHKTMDKYFSAKRKLFKFNSLKKSIINIDCSYGQKIFNEFNNVISVSIKNNKANYFFKELSTNNFKTEFEYYKQSKKIGSYKTNLIGQFNLNNLGLVIATLEQFINIDNKLLENILLNIKPVKGRMEVIKLSNGANIIIDYAHTPDALKNVLKTLKQYQKNNLFCVFGCGGNRDKEKRAIMAKITEQYTNNIIVTEDNSRFENIENIFTDIKKGFTKNNNAIFIEDREQAIKYVINNSKNQDIILLAGKGHECYLDKNGQKLYFDEREIIKKYNDLK